MKAAISARGWPSGSAAALRRVGGEGTVGELARHDGQVVLEGDAHDAHGGAAQPVGVARARRLLAGDPGAGDVVDLVGDGDQAAGQRGGHRRHRRERLIVLGDRLRDGRRGAGLLGVDAADAALQAGKLDDDLAHQVGLGVLGGDHGGRQLAGDAHRQALVGGRRRAPASAAPVGRPAPAGAGRLADRAGQPLREGDQARRLVGERAELGVKDDLAQPAGHGLEALGEVAVVRELGVVEPAFEHALVAVGDELRGGRVGVRDVEERRQQLAARRLRPASSADGPAWR